MVSVICMALYARLPRAIVAGLFVTLLLTRPGIPALLTFRAMGDAPYANWEINGIRNDILEFRSPDAFAIHVGDIQGGWAPDCPESMYQSRRDLFLESELPVFIIPGDNEWNDCTNPAEAWQHWETHIGRFDENWSHGFNVARQDVRDENFAFVDSGVLFLGINMVGGTMHDASEWMQRMTENAEWVRNNFQSFADHVTSAVVFGHTVPHGGIRTQFRDEFIPVVADFAKPVLYLQGDFHYWQVDHPYPEIPNLTRVILEGGSSTPIRVTVTDDPDNPFLFDRDPMPMPEPTTLCLLALGGLLLMARGRRGIPDWRTRT